MKLKIDYQSFIKKGVPLIEDKWGCYYVTGFQGSGKTYFALYYLDRINCTDYKIKTNIKSLNIPSREIEYFTKIDEIIEDIEPNVIYIIDEISKKYSKNSLPDKPFYSWLQQSRKRGRIVILITQEWKEVPMWLRRPARFMFTTKKLPFLPIFYTTCGDALNQTLNEVSLEWECPTLFIYVYKRNKYITQYYDTFEPVNEL